MPSRWQREYMCSMCGHLMYDNYVTVEGFNRLLRRKSLIWLLCSTCVDLIRNMLINATWRDLEGGSVE